MLHAILFWIFASGIIASAIGVVRARSANYSVLLLVINMCLTAGLFVLLQAYLVAIIQVLVYAGAILVLFLFIVMLLDIKELARPREGLRLSKILAFIGCVALFVQIAIVVFSVQIPSAPALEGSAATIGRLLFNRYVIPFELTSVLILSAILSIVVLAKREAR